MGGGGSIELDRFMDRSMEEEEEKQSLPNRFLSLFGATSLSSSSPPLLNNHTSLHSHSAEGVMRMVVF